MGAAKHITVKGPEMSTRKLARRPVHLAAADEVQMNVIHGLAAMRTIVDNEPEAFLQILLASDLRGRHEEMAENLLVAVLGLGELREAVAHLGDQDDVHGALRRDVTEGEHGVILEDDLGRDLLGDDLVEDGRRSGVRGFRGVIGSGGQRGVLLRRGHGRRCARARQVRLQHRQTPRQRREGVTRDADKNEDVASKALLLLRVTTKLWRWRLGFHSSE